MPPTRTTVHTCNKTNEIHALAKKVDKLDQDYNGSGTEPGMKGQLATLIGLVTPMSQDVKMSKEFILNYKERERVLKEQADKKRAEEDKRNRSVNKWVNIAIAVIAFSAFILSAFALKGCAPL